MLTTETRTYVGQPGTIAFDGFAGFVVGQQYELCFERLDTSAVAVQLPNREPGAEPFVVTQEQFEKWWKR